MDKPVISVIVCTHNPRMDYLERVIHALRKQGYPSKNWEILLIDNASEIPLTEKIDLKWHPNSRIICERELGLTPARLCGIREVLGDLLVFVDDDNILPPNFLTAADEISNNQPEIGAWSGQVFPEFEIKPPEWTRRYWNMLVIREFDKDIWSNLPNLPESMPCGAGLCVRSAVAKEYIRIHDAGLRTTLLDRRGQSLISGGDNDLAACACDIGLGVGLFHKLSLTHLIPPNRLTVEYLSRLAEGIHFSSVILRSWRSEHPIPKSWKRKLLDKLRIVILSKNDRKIFAAVCRAEDKAALLLRDKSQ